MNIIDLFCISYSHDSHPKNSEERFMTNMPAEVNISHANRYVSGENKFGWQVYFYLCHILNTFSIRYFPHVLKTIDRYLPNYNAYERSFTFARKRCGSFETLYEKNSGLTILVFPILRRKWKCASCGYQWRN